MISIPCTGEEYRQLEKLLELKTGEPITADKIVNALSDAMERSLTLSRGGGSSRRNALVNDAVQRSRQANVKDVSGRLPPLGIPSALIDSTLRDIRRQGG